MVTTIEGDIHEWVQTTRRGQAGDPRFIMAALKCVDQRCRLLGLDNQEGNRNVGGPVVREVVVESREDIQRLVTVDEAVELRRTETRVQEKVIEGEMI